LKRRKQWGKVESDLIKNRKLKVFKVLARVLDRRLILTGFLSGF
jgi:hypothetical protein